MSIVTSAVTAILPQRKNMPMRETPIKFWIFLSVVLSLFALPPLLFMPNVPAPGTPNAPGPIPAFGPSSALNVSAGAAAIDSIWDAMVSGNKAGPNGIELALTTVRDASGRPFLEARRRDGWSVYAGLHIVPALVWVVAMPFQHVRRLRSTYPVIHRTLGYAVLASATVLSATGLLFPLLNLTYSHPDLFFVHVLRLGASKVPVFAWPTFTMQTHVVGVAFFITTYFTVTTARARDFGRHRWWAQTHTYVGYVIPLQRVSMIGHLTLGHIVARLPYDTQQWLNYPTTNEEAWQAEQAMFACSTWFAFLGMSYVVWRANKAIPQKVKTA